MNFLQVCLGEGAKEESNVVEVTAMNHQGKTVSVPIANLHISCLPMVHCSVVQKKNSINSGNMLKALNSGYSLSSGESRRV